MKKILKDFMASLVAGAGFTLGVVLAAEIIKLIK